MFNVWLIPHRSSVVIHLEMGLKTGLFGLGFAKLWRLAHMVLIELCQEGLVASLWEHALLLKDGEDTHGLLNQIDTGLQVHTEVNESPVNAFLLVLLLLKNEHVVVEELLQTLVGVVDAQLLECVVLLEW